MTLHHDINLYNIIATHNSSEHAYKYIQLYKDKFPRLSWSTLYKILRKNNGHKHIFTSRYANPRSL